MNAVTDREAELKAKVEAERKVAHLLESMTGASRLRRAVKVKHVSEFVKDQRYAAYNECEQRAREAAHALAMPLKSKHAEKYRDVCLLLASAPEFDLEDRPILTVLKKIIESLGGKNLAGDAKDTFHQEVMTPEDLSSEKKHWTPAWKGKVCTGIDMMTHDYKRGAKISLVTYNGGPETDWEQLEITERMLPSFKKRGVDIEVLHFAALDKVFEFILPPGWPVDRQRGPNRIPGLPDPLRHLGVNQI